MLIINFPDPLSTYFKGQIQLLGRFYLQYWCFMTASLSWDYIYTLIMQLNTHFSEQW